MFQVVEKISTRLYHSAVVWTLVFTVVRSFGNLLILPLMLQKLSQEHLGVWYAFLSLAGLSTVIDMGFLPTMSRVTAYVWAGARQVQRFKIAPLQSEDINSSQPNYRLLADLVRTMRLYYLALGVVTTLLLGIFGTNWILRQAQSIAGSRTIIGAWLLFLPAIFVSITSGMWHPLLSGINQVRLNQQILVWSLIANYAITFTALLAGFGLYAPVAGYLAMGFLSRLWAQAKFNQLSQAHAHATTARWSRDLLAALWPMAWRTGFVTLGIYATLNASTLICTVYLGLKATASFGLSSQLALAAVSVAASFLLVKIPLIAQLRARGNTQQIAGMISLRLRLYWLVYAILAAAAIFFGEDVLRDLFHSRTPLLPTFMLITLFAVMGLEGHHGIFREITLTSNENPFTKPVVISGILIVLLSFLLVRWMGLWGLVVAPGVVQLCFNNWWTILVGLRSIEKSPADYFFSLFGLSRDRPAATTPGRPFERIPRP